MKIRTLFLICCATLWTLSAVNAQIQKQESVSKQVVHIKKLDKHVSELMADRVSIRKDIELKELATLEEEELEERENLLFPADELYGANWENEFVNPFRGKTNVVFPDSFSIDCSSFVYPIAIDSIARVTSPYGPRRRRMHRGIDLKVLVGDTIRAAFAGKVRITSFERRGYGNYIVIRHPNGLETVYGHLSKLLIGVNDIVKAGDPIALGGNTGRSSGSHLHFETRFLGQAINPAEIIDFANGVPIQDTYVFHNVKVKGRKTNIYTSSSNQMVYHRVKSGDTLGKIARIYGISVKELCRLNGLKTTSILRIGQSLRCSAGVSATVSDKKNAPVKTKVNADASAVASLGDKKSSAEVKSEEKTLYHKIQPGDTLGGLAAKYGTTVAKICEWNGISTKTILKIGRSLRCS